MSPAMVWSSTLLQTFFKIPLPSYMNGQLLEITHLGHILSFNIRDKNYILRATKDLNRKANYKIKLFCLSLYGCCSDIIQVALNHVIRKIWKLPRQSHTSICHCIAQIPAIRNQIMERFHSLYKSAVSSSSPLVKSVFSCYNTVYRSKHVKLYSYHDVILASIIYDIRNTYGFHV